MAETPQNESSGGLRHGPRFSRDLALMIVPALTLLALAALGGAQSWALATGGGALTALALVYLLWPRLGNRRVLAATLPRGHGGAESLPVLSIVEQLPDPFVLLDSSGRVLLANRAAHQLIQAAAPGRHISAALRVPRILEAVTHVLKGGSAQAVDYSVLVPIEQHLRAHVSPIQLPLDESGREQRLALIVVHDLTSVKRLERMRADFVASASHELRTPLASLTGFIETLRGPAREDAQARDRFLAIMEEQAARMGRLVEDLLSLSRIELNEHVPPASLVDLRSVLADVVDAVAPLARERGVEIEIRGDTPGPVRGDRDELVQVFQNLVDNALKYAAEGKRIEIELGQGQPDMPGAPAGLAYSVAVRDFGQGIPREHLPRLTERFYRVSVKQSREQGGTGLGLAIVKHIVSRHRGMLDVESTPGKGSCFTVYFPPAGQMQSGPGVRTVAARRESQTNSSG